MTAGLEMTNSRYINRPEVIRGRTQSSREVIMYVYLSSKPSALYPENTAADFTIQLPRTIADVHECGVVEVRLPTVPRAPLFVCFDLCVESITNSTTLPVLRRIGQKIFLANFVTYVPLRVQNLDTIRLYIRKETGEKVNFPGETKITLHIR